MIRALWLFVHQILPCIIELSGLHILYKLIEVMVFFVCSNIINYPNIEFNILK